MKKNIPMAIGIVCMVLGAGGTGFWGQAIREGRFMSSAQSEQDVQQELPFFTKGVELLGVDVFTPPAAETAASPADLARRIARGFYTCFSLSIISLLAGLTAVITARRKQSVAANTHP